MQDPHDASPSPASVDAASVLLLRDGPLGLEVFMIQRHEKSGGYGGAYVFPGGKVDADDNSDDLQQHLDQPPEALHAALHERDQTARAAAGIYIAAIREVFEECGVLLAQGGAGAPAPGAAPLRQVLRSLGLKLDTRQLLPWSRWVTPVNSMSSPARRFDTRFFVARVPAHQAARHDNHEAINSQWLTPRAALESYWRGDITLVPPQLMSLSHLASHGSAASVLREASARPPHVVRPAVTEVDGLRTMAYPGDPLNPDTNRVMPGPTRLVVRNGRAEPLLGFEGLFGPHL